MREHPEALGFRPDYMMQGFQPTPVPEPSTGWLVISSREPDWLQGLGPVNRLELPSFMLARSWWAAWYADEGPGVLNSPHPLMHRLGVLEWAARQPAARAVIMIGNSEVPVELTAVNRPPDPGTGYLRIALDSSRPIWYAVWFDIYTGLVEFTDDDLRQVIEWAQAQAAEDKLIRGDALPEQVDLAEFLEHPDWYLQAL
ncbi:hypothetical protein [Actinopolymorpha alba]|uniref:hypothetical protein n=1 Tax=Actinopolymorpha alba TaxID=533267 RepID=UPI00036DB4A8|nr:hypothetical protein [Actinopolymorpha alba]